MRKRCSGAVRGGETGVLLLAGHGHKAGAALTAATAVAQLALEAIELHPSLQGRVPQDGAGGAVNVQLLSQEVDGGAWSAGRRHLTKVNSGGKHQFSVGWAGWVIMLRARLQFATGATQRLRSCSYIGALIGRRSLSPLNQMPSGSPFLADHPWNQTMGLPWYRVHTVVINDPGRLLAVHIMHTALVAGWGGLDGPVRTGRL